MLELTKPYKDLVFCGDFNIPRPNKYYQQLRSTFTDNVPEQYLSSIDPDLHHIKGLQKMVDYIWTRGVCKVTNVHFKNGVSDHLALIGEII